MGIELGEDYLKAAKENIEKGISASKRDSKHLFVICTVTLTAWVMLAYYLKFPSELMISGTIAVATICLIGVLNYRTTALEADIIYMSGAIEWFGQKKLDYKDIR